MPRNFNAPAAPRLLAILPGKIGDALCTVPALRTLARELAPSRFDLLVSPVGADLFRAADFATSCLSWRRTDPLRDQFALVQTLRAARYDLAVIFPASFQTAFIPWLAGIPFRIGVAGDGRSPLLSRTVRGFSGSYTTPYLPAPQFAEPSSRLKNIPGIHHLVFSNLAVIEPIIPHARWLLDCSLPSAAEDRAWAAQAWTEMSLGTKPVLALNPGSAETVTRRWPAENFSVLGALAMQRGWQVLVLNGPGEIELARSIAAAMPIPATVAPAGTTIGQLGALIARCQCLVTNDSGPNHLGSAVGIRCLTLHGPTHPAGTFPFADGCFSLSVYADCADCSGACRHELRCWNGFTPERVAAEVGSPDTTNVSPTKVT